MMLTDMPVVYAGGGFPWGLLIIGGILYLFWRNGAFDRFNGPGGPGRQGFGPRHGGYYQDYSPARQPEDRGYGPGGYGQGGHDAQRQAFEEWHRQAHEGDGAQAQAQAHTHGGPAPAAPAAPAPGTGEAPR